MGSTSILRLRVLVIERRLLIRNVDQDNVGNSKNDGMKKLENAKNEIIQKVRLAKIKLYSKYDTI